MFPPLLLVLQLLTAGPGADEAWRWARFDRAGGLPSDVVRTVVDAPDGVWAVTDGGPAWFDGFWWRSVQGDAPVLRGGVAAAESLPGGRLLLVTEGELHVGGPRGFRRVHVVLDGDTLPVTDAVPLPGDRALVVSVDRFLEMPLGGAGRPVVREPPAPLPEVAHLASLWRTRSGALWLVASYRLWRSDDAGRTWSSWLPEEARVGRISGVAETEAGGVVAVDHPLEHMGVWTWGPNGRPTPVEGEGRVHPVSVAIGDDGVPVVAYDGAVFRSRSRTDGRWSSVPVPLPAGHFVADIRAGRDGRLWIATDDGLHLRRGRSELWTSWVHPFPDLRNRVHDILTEPDGTVWIANGGGVEVRPPGEGPVWHREAAGVSLAEATGLARDRDGSLWIVSGGEFTGAVRYRDGRFDHVEAAPGTTDDPLRFHRVRPGPEGRLWFLGLGRSVGDRYPDGPGIFVVDDDHLVRLPLSDSLPSGRVYDVSVDGDTVWVATIRGLSRLTPDGRWRHWGVSDGLALPRVFTVAADGRGGAWFGDQASGLGHVDAGGSVTYRTRSDGLVDDEVWSVLVDDGDVWVATGGGISHWDGDTFSSLRTEDGLPGLQVWPLARRGDRLYSGSLGAGVAVLDLSETGRPPRVRVDEVVSGDGAVTVRWTAASEWGLMEPRQVRTRWRLDEGAWSPWNRSREVTLADVEPGAHHFEVQARGLLDAVSPVAPPVEIVVEPPIWGRVSFLAPLGLLLVLLASILTLARIRRGEYRAALEHSRERYRRFFHEDVTGDFLLDENGRIADCNPAFARIFGYGSPEEARGRKAWELLPERTVGIDTLRALQSSGRLEHLQLELRRRDGRTVHVVGNLVAQLGEDGRLEEVRGYVFDDTVRKELERRLVEAQRIEAVGRLAGGIAHEFNNVLAAITGFAALLLEDTPADDPRRADLEAIIHAGHRGKELTSQLLAFGRRRVLRPSVLDINDVVRGMESLLLRTCGDRCTVRTRYGLDLPVVHADPDHLEQVLLHLVLNAREAMPEEGGTIRIATAAKKLTVDEATELDGAMAGRYVVLEVRDDGRGMEPEERERMFEPFYTTKGDGAQTVGLGLPMVYGLVRQNAGFIDVWSAPGRGTRVTVHLPAWTGQLVRSAATDEGAGESRPTARMGEVAESVLVVDGEEVVRRLAERTLRDQGFHVVTARTGSEAVRAVTESEGRPPLLILAGAELPDGPAQSLVDRVRDASGTEPRVLLLTDPIEFTPDVEPGTSEPPSISRSFTPEGLLGAIRALMERG